MGAIVTGWRLVMARRGARLLMAGYGVTCRYAVAAIDAGLVDAEELRAAGVRKCRRWYLA